MATPESFGIASSFKTLYMYSRELTQDLNSASPVLRCILSRMLSRMV